MAQDVDIAGLGGPVAVTDTGLGSLAQVAGEAGRRFREQSLESRVQNTANEAAELAESTRNRLTAAQGTPFGAGARSPTESAALLQTAESTTAEELLSAREREVTKDANRVFGRYRRALAQGATNASAARIAVEKEMQDLISQNPAFADTIRQAAATAMGQTEFQLLTQDRAKASSSGNSYTSQYQKDLASINDALDDMAAIGGWSQEMLTYRKEQAAQDLINRTLLDNTNELFSAEQTNDTNTVQVRINALRSEGQVKANEILNTGLDLMSTTDGSFLGEQNLAQMKARLNGIANEYRLRVDAAIPANITGEQRNQMIENAVAPITQIIPVLEQNRASEVLGAMQSAINAGSKISMSQMLPLATALSDTFGQNYPYVVKLFTPGRQGELAFQNTGLVPDLQNAVNKGTLQREQIPALLLDRINTNVNAALTGGPTDWNTINNGYLAPMASGAPKNVRNGDEKYGQVTERSAAATPRELAKVIVGTPDIDQFQSNAVDRFTSLVDNRAQVLKERVTARNRQDNYQTYVMATVGSDNRVKFVEYTAVLGTDPDTGEDVWRVQGQRPIEDLSTAVGTLTNRYGLGNGTSRSLITHPQLSPRFGGVDEAQYIQELQDTINSSQPVPEWLNVRQATGQTDEAVSGGRVSGFFSAVGEAIGDILPGASEATLERRRQALARNQQQGGPITVDRIRRAVSAYNNNQNLSGEDRALAGIALTPNAQDFGMTQEQFYALSEEDRYRLIADTINQRSQ